MSWDEVFIRRGVRQRTAQHEPPQALSLLSKEDKDLLATWVRKDNVSRSRESLLKEAGISNIDRAEALSDWLLREGWITRKEKLQGGCWQWEGLIWRDLDRLPGRPSQDWIRAIRHLLQLAPAPLRVSADADPAGIDIALTVGRVWESQAQEWEPYRMGVVEWQAVSQKWPLNDHDISLLQRLLSDTNLPEQMAALGKAMLLEGRKAEQEGWL